jgi:glycosyltransferase involved in cell wall biosynthesis
LLHAHFGSAPATVALLLSYWLRCPFGFSVHARDLYAERNALAGKARRASHVISCSEVAAEDLRSRLPAELRSRVELHHHGLDLELWQPRHGANERTDEALILAVGRFEAKKGFAHLVDACAVLARDGFRFRCELIGAGREERRLARRIRRRGLEDRVRIVAWYSPPRLREHYATASVLAVPSVIDADGDRDGIPNVLIEALACGVPVVASSIASLERLLGPARAARLTPPGDGDALAHALRQVCTDAVLARSLAENGRRLVEARFDLRRNARELRARLARSAVSPIQPGAVPEEPRPRPTAHRWRIISSAVEGSSRRGPDRLPS